MAFVGNRWARKQMGAIERATRGGQRVAQGSSRLGFEAGAWQEERRQQRRDLIPESLWVTEVGVRLPTLPESETRPGEAARSAGKTARCPVRRCSSVGRSIRPLLWQSACQPSVNLDLFLYPQERLRFGAQLCSSRFCSTVPIL